MISLPSPRACAAAALLAGLAPGLRAQRVESSVDAAGGSVWYADTLGASGISVSPSVRADWSRATLAATATASEMGSDGWSLQGAVAPSVFTPSVGPLTLEIAGVAGGSTHRDGTRTGQILGTTRLHLMNRGQGLWVGGGLGRMWDGAAWRDVKVGEFGAWLERRATTVVATASPVAVDDTIHYTDFQGALRYVTGSWELGAEIGARSGATAIAVNENRAWGSGSAMLWLTPTTAIVASGGSYPVDLTQGFPGGKFVSLGLRLASRNVRGSDRAPAQTASPLAAAASASERAIANAEEETRALGVSGFEVTAAPDGERVIRVKAPSARTVEIASDFTQWKPLALTRGSDGWWSVTLPLAPGTYQINLRVDGGAWLVPPGLVAVSDEFGGNVGILAVP